MYDPEAGTWEIYSSMSTPRSGVSAVVLNEKVYIIGGFNGIDRLKTVECFSVGATRCVWEAVPDMITPRSNFAVSVLDGKIIVAG